MTQRETKKDFERHGTEKKRVFEKQKKRQSRWETRGDHRLQTPSGHLPNTHTDTEVGWKESDFCVCVWASLCVYVCMYML